MADPSSSPPSICISATPEDAGARLDRFLADRTPAISRSRLKTLILEGFVQCDGAVTRDASAPVHPGSTYRLALPAAAPATPQGQDIGLTILYEDDALIVLDKPAGLVVHPAPGNPDGTLVNALIAHCGDSLTGIGGERRPGIVHRLDKDTSGIMVAAKTELAHTRLSAAFASRNIERAYLALCWGVPNPTSGAITGDIGRDPRDRKRMAVVTRNGKSALTNYEIIRNFGLAAALLTCRLATGRTHQIRVHLATAGHPLIGDPVYLRRRPAAAKLLAPDLQSRALDFPRQALHAEILGFSHPITGVPLSFRTAPPADFRELADALQACG